MAGLVAAAPPTELSIGAQHWPWQSFRPCLGSDRFLSSTAGWSMRCSSPSACTSAAASRCTGASPSRLQCVRSASSTRIPGWRRWRRMWRSVSGRPPWPFVWKLLVTAGCAPPWSSAVDGIAQWAPASPRRKTELSSGRRGRCGGRTRRIDRHRRRRDDRRSGMLLAFPHRAAPLPRRSSGGQRSADGRS